MSSINDKIRAVLKSAVPSDVTDADIRNDGRHLPRFARTFVRRVERFVETARPVRGGVGSVLAVGFVVSGLLWGAFQGGHGPVVLAGAGKVVGLNATDIVITGQVKTTEQDVFNALGLSKTRSLVGFDAGDARQRVLDLPWVKEVAIRKLYPGKLLVALKEKDAFAVWQHNDKLSVVQQDGELISPFGISDLISDRFSGLPHLVGEGAATHAGEVLPITDRYPQLAERIEAYVRVANRRWDIQFTGDVRVKLPEHGTMDAVARLSALDADRELLARAVDVIDLRVADRVTLRLLADAAEDRAEFVANRLKAIKKAEHRL